REDGEVVVRRAEPQEVTQHTTRRRFLTGAAAVFCAPGPIGPKGPLSVRRSRPFGLIERCYDLMGPIDPLIRHKTLQKRTNRHTRSLERCANDRVRRFDRARGTQPADTAAAMAAGIGV